MGAAFRANQKLFAVKWAAIELFLSNGKKQLYEIDIQAISFPF